jgi:GcrA cell cycle regulator
MKTGKMSWSKERVALLTELWAEGLSASLIASRLGGVTRNAVIGKVHRLGFPGRIATTRKHKPHSSRSGGHATPRAAPPQSKPVCSIHSALALKPCGQPPPPPTPLLQIVRQADRRPDDGPGVRLLDLDAGMCRWPKGHPRDGPFRFCGRGAAEGQSYCARHARLAFKITRCRTT